LKIVALLPMKANSERVIGKNFKSFCGKPLYRWMLDTLISVEAIDKIVINTDARSILAANGLVESDRIIIRDRPDEICGDMVSMNLVIQDDVENIEADHFLMTHTTNPLLSEKTIRGAIDTYLSAVSSGDADSLFTVNKIQTRFYDSQARPVNHDPERLVRTQDLEPWFEENSNLYLFSRDSFLETKARIGGNPMMFESPALESIDIDTPDDWALAEVMVQFYRQKGVI
jgi:CMP-N-acetylneuraminic acid synthetase